MVRGVPDTLVTVRSASARRGSAWSSEAVSTNAISVMVRGSTSAIIAGARGHVS